MTVLLMVIPFKKRSIGQRDVNSSAEVCSYLGSVRFSLFFVAADGMLFLVRGRVRKHVGSLWSRIVHFPNWNFAPV